MSLLKSSNIVKYQSLPFLPPERDLLIAREHPNPSAGSSSTRPALVIGHVQADSGGASRGMLRAAGRGESDFWQAEETLGCTLMKKRSEQTTPPRLMDWLAVVVFARRQIRGTFSRKANKAEGRRQIEAFASRTNTNESSLSSH